jgi:predicted Zn-dependent protease
VGARGSHDRKAWEARLRRISAPFAEDPLVFRSNVSLSVDSDNRYYTNSEGSQIVTGDVACRLFIQAVTKADDGMELPLYQSYFASSPSGLPDEKQLIADARSMMEMLARLRKAPLVDHHHDAITEAVGSKKTEQLKKLLGDLIKNIE